LKSPAAPVEASKKELARAQAVFSLLHAYFLSVCAAADIEPNVRCYQLVLAGAARAADGTLPNYHEKLQVAARIDTLVVHSEFCRPYCRRLLYRNRS
jgi:hypothetical protein